MWRALSSAKSLYVAEQDVLLVRSKSKGDPASTGPGERPNAEHSAGSGPVAG
jgi:hypothetical protein